MIGSTEEQTSATPASPDAIPTHLRTTMLDLLRRYTRDDIYDALMRVYSEVKTVMEG